MLPHGCLAAKKTKKQKKKNGDSKLEQRSKTDAMIPLVPMTMTYMPGGYLGFNIKELKTSELHGLNMINISF